MKKIFLILLLAFVFVKTRAQETTEPLSPPQLIIPENGEWVKSSRPFFSWLPITPVNLFKNISYDWVLVDLLGDQTASDAIQQNIPVFTQRNLRSASFQYPLSAPALDTNKQYAWRVTAVNNISPVANSEVWVFHFKKADSVKQVQVGRKAYIKAKKEQDASLAVVSGIVKYEYLNELNDSLVYFTISDITGPAQQQVPVDSSFQQIHFGRNLMEIDLRKNKLLINKHIYLLQLTNSRNDKWYLKFEYRNPKD